MLAKHFQPFVSSLGIFHARVETVPLRVLEFLREFYIDGGSVPPALLGERSLVLDEVACGVHQQHTLNLCKNKVLELIGGVMGCLRFVHTAVQTRASAPTGFLPGVEAEGMHPLIPRWL